MGRVANPELASLWRERVEGQRRSGLSILEYCRRQGWSAGNFHAWKRRLRGGRSPAEPKPPARTSRRQAPRGGFVQLPLVAESMIEVCFADGTLLKLPGGNLAALTATVKALRDSQSEGVIDA